MEPSTIAGTSCHNSRTIDGRFIDEEIDEEMSNIADHWEQVPAQPLVATNHLGNKSGEGDCSTGDNSNTHNNETWPAHPAKHHDPHDWPVVPYTTSDPEGDDA